MVVSSAQTREGRRATVVCLLGALVRFASAYRCACLLVVSTRADMAVVCCRRRSERGRERGRSAVQARGNEGTRGDVEHKTRFYGSPNVDGPVVIAAQDLFNPNPYPFSNPQTASFKTPNPHDKTGIPCCVHAGRRLPASAFSLALPISAFFPFRT